MIPGVIIKEGRCQLSFTGMHEEEERELKVCGAREHHGFNGQKCEQQKEFLRQARQYILCAYFKIWKDLDKLTTR